MCAEERIATVYAGAREVTWYVEITWQRLSVIYTSNNADSSEVFIECTLIKPHTERVL